MIQNLPVAVAGAVENQLKTLERREIAAASWRDFGAIITVSSLREAVVLSDRIAPEHLELCVADPKALSAQITHAGAIFLGGWTPEAIGDYIGGPNHVLPYRPLCPFQQWAVCDGFSQTHYALR
jgi:histidinol dehydrogenase